MHKYRAQASLLALTQARYDHQAVQAEPGCTTLKTPECIRVSNAVCRACSIVCSSPAEIVHWTADMSDPSCGVMVAITDVRYAHRLSLNVPLPKSATTVLPKCASDLLSIPLCLRL